MLMTGETLKKGRSKSNKNLATRKKTKFWLAKKPANLRNNLEGTVFIDAICRGFVRQAGLALLACLTVERSHPLLD